jgi:hypothetical protein
MFPCAEIAKENANVKTTTINKRELLLDCMLPPVDRIDLCVLSRETERTTADKRLRQIHRSRNRDLNPEGVN